MNQQHKCTVDMKRVLCSFFNSTVFKPEAKAKTRLLKPISKSIFESFKYRINKSDYKLDNINFIYSMNLA